MDIIGPFVNVIDTYLIAPFVQRINILKSSSDNLRDLQDKVRELKAAWSDKRHKLDEAEIAGQVQTDTASNWFKVVQEIEVQATAVEEVYHQQTCAGGLCVNCWSLYKLSKRSVELTQRAGDMLDKQFDLARQPPPKSVIEMEGEPIENQPSAEHMLQQMLSHLNGPDIGIIGVYGMGGVGKTTLAIKVNNHFISKENSPFDTVIMVTVSATPNIPNIQTSIGKRLGLDLSNDSQDDAKGKLLDALRKKKFLLILDDVWHKFELKDVGIPHPRNHKGSKILITSRIKDTCTQMDAKIKMKVQPLTRDESWNLFVKKAGQHVTADRIKCFVETIVGKCKGLPLAIVTVAHAMADRDGVGEWADAIREMEESATNLRGMEEEVFVPLKFSFDRLDDDMLRSLFLYCACFPEDRTIRKEEILNFCVGEGLVDRFGSLTAASNKGEALIGSLKIASMLEDGEHEGTVKMHDMMRELALWITSSTSDSSPKFLTRTSESSEETPPSNEWVDVTRISLFNTDMKELPKLGERCQKLTTLIMKGNRNLITLPPANFFQHMDHLSILDFSFLHALEYLPDFLSCLVNLRVLRLQNCRRLRALPALGMLRQLQVLDLYFCLMLDQPIIGSECKGGLSNLRFLDVSYSKVFIPMGVLSRLLKLEDLRLDGAENIKWKVESVENEERDGSGYNDGSKGQRDEGNIIINEEVQEERRSGLSSDMEVGHQPSSINIIDVGELSHLAHLTSLSVSFEGITISDWFKPLAKKMRGTLVLQCCIIIKQDAIQALNESQNLSRLYLYNCPGLRCVPTRVEYLLQIQNCEDMEKVLDGAEAYQDSFQTIYGLYLSGLPKLERICVGLAPLNCFGQLEKIFIRNCNILKMVFTKEMPHQFNNLEVIMVEDCHGMEVIIEEEGGEILMEVSNNNNRGALISPFPKLKGLFLKNLPALTGLCNDHHILHCPLLETVMVENCLRLKKDPLHICNDDGLLVIEEEMTRWGSGNSENDDIRNYLFFELR